MAATTIVLLDNPVRSYAWGSREVLARLSGRPVPSAEPEAELWIGAHPSAPSRLGADGPRLDDEIRRDPLPVLGTRLHDAFGPELPFLMKILAVERPLSLQVHPNAEQARAGFAREEAAGVERGDPRRTYPDANAKAEIVCALGPFEALVGFREFGEIRDRLASLAPETSDAILRDAGRAAPGDEIATLVKSLLRLERRTAECLLQEVRDRIGSETSEDDGAAWTERLLAEFPADPAALAPILLHHVELVPGEALFLPPGIPHSYLRGVAVELMTSSDNVVRAGLTTKHVDVDELLDVLSVQPFTPVAIRVSAQPGHWVSYLDADGPFRLDRARVERGRPLRASSDSEPVLLLVTEGTATLRDPQRGTIVDLGPAQAALVPACVDAYELDGDATIHRARSAGPHESR